MSGPAWQCWASQRFSCGEKHQGKWPRHAIVILSASLPETHRWSKACAHKSSQDRLFLTRPFQGLNHGLATCSLWTMHRESKFAKCGRCQHRLVLYSTGDNIQSTVTAGNLPCGFLPASRNRSRVFTVAHLRMDLLTLSSTFSLGSFL